MVEVIMLFLRTKAMLNLKNLLEMEMKPLETPVSIASETFLSNQIQMYLLKLTLKKKMVMVTMTMMMMKAPSSL